MAEPTGASQSVFSGSISDLKKKKVPPCGASVPQLPSQSTAGGAPPEPDADHDVARTMQDEINVDDAQGRPEFN